MCEGSETYMCLACHRHSKADEGAGVQRGRGAEERSQASAL